MSRAVREGKQIVNGLDIGGECALIGVQLIPTIDEEKENLVIMLAAVGGRQSPIMDFQPRPVVVHEIAKVPLASLRRAFAGGAPEPTSPTADGAPDALTLTVVK